MSPSGYKTNFSENLNSTDYFTYILKGEASCSGFIKRISDEFPDLDKDIYYCAVDPESIDAVVFPEKKIIICDSITPHLFEPKIAGISGQIVNLSESWDTEKLSAERNLLEELHTSLISQSERAERCIKALSTVVYDNFDLATRTVLLEKLDAYFGRLCKKILPKHSKNQTDDNNENRRGRVSYKLITAITAAGITTLTPKEGNIYILNDDFYAGSHYLLSRLIAEAASRGFDVTVSLNPIMTDSDGGKVLHIHIPELSLWFLTSSGVAPTDCSRKITTVNFMRFYTKNLLSAKRQRMRFNADAAMSLLSEAVGALQTVRDVKSSTEKYYEKVIEGYVIEEVKAKIVKSLQ
jgi:hypothetical protein